MLLYLINYRKMICRQIRKSANFECPIISGRRTMLLFWTVILKQIEKFMYHSYTSCWPRFCMGDVVNRFGLYSSSCRQVPAHLYKSLEACAHLRWWGKRPRALRRSNQSIVWIYLGVGWSEDVNHVSVRYMSK